MNKNAQALVNLLKAIDANAEVPASGNVADIINAIAAAVAAKAETKGKSASKSK